MVRKSGERDAERTGQRSADARSGLGVEKNEARAEALFAALSEETSPESLGEIAWVYATHPVEDLRRPELALKLAQQAHAKDPNDDTKEALAAAYAASGEYRTAVSMLREILRTQVNPLDRIGMEARLTAFEKRQPWTEGVPRRGNTTTSKETRIRSVATFSGEIIGIFQRPSERIPPGYAVEPEAQFGIAVLVGHVASGSLPHFMAEQAIFYIHSPTQFLSRVKQDLEFLQPPEGLFRFHLQETETDVWRHTLSFEELEPASLTPGIGNHIPPVAPSA